MKSAAFFSSIRIHCKLNSSFDLMPLFCHYRLDSNKYPRRIKIGIRFCFHDTFFRRNRALNGLSWRQSTVLIAQFWRRFPTDKNNPFATTWSNFLLKLSPICVALNWKMLYIFNWVLLCSLFFVRGNSTACYSAYYENLASFLCWIGTELLPCMAHFCNININVSTWISFLAYYIRNWCSSSNIS